MSFKTLELQDLIIAKVKEVSDLEVIPLLTKSDLNKTAVIPYLWIQYSGANYLKNSRNIGSNFNIYIVHKTLNESERSSLIQRMDDLRSCLLTMKIEYIDGSKKYVSNQYPSKIIKESITESESSTFVYVFSIEIEVRL